MKDKIIKILKAELFPIQLVDDSDPIEIMGVDKAADKIEQLYASQPAVSEEEIDEIAKEWAAIHYGRGYGLSAFKSGFKAAQSLNVQGGAVSEDKLSEIFANHADNTPYLNFTAFKEAIKELLNQKR